MSRPPFLSRPEVWTRTKRTGTNAIDYACPLHGKTRGEISVGRWLLAGIGIVGAMLLFVHFYL